MLKATKCYHINKLPTILEKDRNRMKKISTLIICLVIFSMLNYAQEQNSNTSAFEKYSTEQDVINQSFYITGGLAAGGGLINTKLFTRYTNEEFTQTTSYPIFRMDGLAALGYNSKRFFAGTHIVASMEHYKQGNSTTTVTNEALTFQIFAGYRFNAPKSMTKLFDKAPF